MLLAASVTVLIWLTSAGLGRTDETKLVIATSSPDVTTIVNLTCGRGEWIYVKEYRQNNYTSQIAYIQLEKKCVGLQSCTVDLGTATLTHYITYECINTQRFGLCDSTVQDAPFNDQIQLHSHSYPVSRAIDRICSCTIRGSDMIATAYELKLTSPIATFSYLNDRGYTDYLNLEGTPLYATKIGNETNEMTLTFYDGGLDDQQVWINVKAPGRMEVSCVRSPPSPESSSLVPPASTLRHTEITSSSGQITAPPTTPLPLSLTPPTRATTTTSVSATSSLASASSSMSSLPSMTATSTAPLNSTVTLPVILIISGLAFFILVLGAVVIGICLKYRRKMKSVRMDEGPVHFQAATPSPRGVNSIPEYLHLVNTNHEYSQLHNDGRRQTSVHEYSEFHAYETFQP